MFRRSISETHGCACLAVFHLTVGQTCTSCRPLKFRGRKRRRKQAGVHGPFGSLQKQSLKGAETANGYSKISTRQSEQTRPFLEGVEGHVRKSSGSRWGLALSGVLRNFLLLPAREPAGPKAPGEDEHALSGRPRVTGVERSDGLHADTLTSRKAMAADVLAAEPGGDDGGEAGCSGGEGGPTGGAAAL